MAKESKSITVAPAEEQSTIELWQVFGWELVSSQEIYSKDSHLEGSGGEVYSVTSTTNYVKLLFSRDTDISNYSAKAKLQNEYESLRMPIQEKPKGFFILSLVFWGIGAVLVEQVNAILGVGVVLIGFVMVVLGFIKRSKSAKEYEEKCAELKNKRRKIIEQAMSLN